MNRLSRFIVISIVTLLIVFIAGYLWLVRGGSQYNLDRDVEEKYLAGREVVDAVMFFEQGGMYEGLSPRAAIDQDHVLPLARLLRDDFRLKPVVALVEPGQAMGLFVEVPSDPAIRRQIGAALQKADDSFPGLLTDHWGQKWISLDWLDERELPALEASGVLELIKQDHEQYRKNP